MENRPTNKHLFFRAFLIYIITILFGTTITSFLLSNGGGHDFISFLYTGFVFTGLAALPNILFLFLGFRFIYKKYSSFKRIYLSHFLLGLLLCVVPILLFIIVMLGSIFIRKIDEGIFLYFLMATPYSIIALLSIHFINYFFDKKNNFEFMKQEKREDDNILDDIR